MKTVAYLPGALPLFCFTKQKTMKTLHLAVLLLLVMKLSAQPIALHPDNPHYLLYKGQPTLLITSAEHYGAVLNADFDYEKYLESLQQQGMNYTRIFTGSYVEIPKSFGIVNNSLAPAVGRFLAPWKRVSEAGLFEGEGKFDFDQWEPTYFERLRGFVAAAEARDIIVEVTLFCATYNDELWKRHPFNPGNNVNQIGNLGRREFNTLKNPKVIACQKAMIEKIAGELNAYDNVIYEICNEPWADDQVRSLPLLKTIMPRNSNHEWLIWAPGASQAMLDWQRELTATMVAAEKTLAKRHLIAQNYANFKQSLTEVDPQISMLNFHYAWPEVVQMNYGWECPINFDESGFSGSADSTYLAQAWAFMLAGGAIFNNLDYSFYVGAEDGTGTNEAPGGGSTVLRKQLRVLHDFLRSFHFIRMRPDYGLVYHAPGLETYVLSEPGQQYAIALHGQSRGFVKLNAPKGRYSFEWISPADGSVLASGSFRSKGGYTTLQFDHPESLHALRIIRQ